MFQKSKKGVIAMARMTVSIRGSQQIYEEITKMIEDKRAETQAEALDKIFVDLKSAVVIQATKIEQLQAKIAEQEKEVKKWKGLATK